MLLLQQVLTKSLFPVRDLTDDLGSLPVVQDCVSRAKRDSGVFLAGQRNGLRLDSRFFKDLSSKFEPYNRTCIYNIIDT